MEYFQYRKEFRDPYFVDSEGRYLQMRDGAALNFELGILDSWLYWKNRIHMDMDYTPQPRHVGWEWEAGAHIPFIPLDVFQHHHSRHGMEYRHPDGLRFPVEDSVGIRLRLIEKDR